jgi:hypothetical protein
MARRAFPAGMNHLATFGPVGASLSTRRKMICRAIVIALEFVVSYLQSAIISF